LKKLNFDKDPFCNSIPEEVNTLIKSNNITVCDNDEVNKNIDISNSNSEDINNQNNTSNSLLYSILIIAGIAVFLVLSILCFVYYKRKNQNNTIETINILHNTNSNNETTSITIDGNSFTSPNNTKDDMNKIMSISSDEVKIDIEEKKASYINDILSKEKKINDNASISSKNSNIHNAILADTTLDNNNDNNNDNNDDDDANNDENLPLPSYGEVVDEIINQHLVNASNSERSEQNKLHSIVPLNSTKRD